MRLGLVLGDNIDSDWHARVDAAEALGLWAVLVSGPSGTESLRASRVAERTQHLRIAMQVDLTTEHPLTIAEEVTVLDSISAGRALVVVKDNVAHATLQRFCEALIGRLDNAVVMAPPTVQTQVPVWLAEPCEGTALPIVVDAPNAIVMQPGSPAPGRSTLSGNLPEDRRTIDAWRDAGCTHLFVSWPGELLELARHLATRAATADFPELVAELADG